MWTTMLVLVQLIPIHLFWHVPEKYCRAFMYVMVLIWYYLVILVGFVNSMKTLFFYGRRVSNWLAACSVMVLAVSFIFFVDWILMSYQKMACHSWGWKAVFANFVIVLVLICCATYFALKAPRLYLAILRSQERVRYIKILKSSCT